MAVLAMVFSGAVLLLCALILAQRLTRGQASLQRTSQRRRPAQHCADGGEAGWLPLAVGGDSASDCGAADAGGGCDGGGGGD